jgi:hypothetical protein
MMMPGLSLPCQACQASNCEEGAAIEIEVPNIHDRTPPSPTSPDSDIGSRLDRRYRDTLGPTARVEGSKCYELD